MPVNWTGLAPCTVRRLSVSEFFRGEQEETLALGSSNQLTRRIQIWKDVCAEHAFGPNAARHTQRYVSADTHVCSSAHVRDPVTPARARLFEVVREAMQCGRLSTELGSVSWFHTFVLLYGSDTLHLYSFYCIFSAAEVGTGVWVRGAAVHLHPGARPPEPWHAIAVVLHAGPRTSLDSKPKSKWMDDQGRISRSG